MIIAWVLWTSGGTTKACSVACVCMKDKSFHRILQGGGFSVCNSSLATIVETNESATELPDSGALHGRSVSVLRGMDFTAAVANLCPLFLPHLPDVCAIMLY